MNTNPKPSGQEPSLETMLTDESLRELRRAYHALEAQQLSAEHQSLKEQLKRRLSEQPQGKRRLGTP